MPSHIKNLVNLRTSAFAILTAVASLGVASLAPAQTPTSRIELTSTTPTNRKSNFGSFDPLISANGRYVVFESSDNDTLVANDNNAYADVFRRDRQTGTTELVSVNRTGTSSRTRPSLQPNANSAAMTPGGRYVVFQSDATDLTATPDTNASVDVFRRDLRLSQTVLISVNRLRTATGNNDSVFYPLVGGAVVTRNGRDVLFISFATNLTDAVTNTSSDVFLYTDNAPKGRAIFGRFNRR